MRWIIAVAVVFGIGSGHAEERISLAYFDDLIEEGFQIIGITPDGNGGHVYHLQKPGDPMFICRARVLAAGLEPSMEQYCHKVMR